MKTPTMASICTLTGVLLLLNFSPKAQASPAVASYLASSKVVNTNASDTIQEVANLEVTRAIEITTFTPNSPSILALDKKLNRLYQSLTKDQEPAVNEAVSEALQAKITEVEKARSNASDMYTDSHPYIINLDSKIRNLRERLSQIK